MCSYVFFWSCRYGHRGQYKWITTQSKKLKTYLDRAVRDIEWKARKKIHFLLKISYTKHLSKKRFYKVQLFSIFFKIIIDKKLWEEAITSISNKKIVKLWSKWFELYVRTKKVSQIEYLFYTFFASITSFHPVCLLVFLKTLLSDIGFNRNKGMR